MKPKDLWIPCRFENRRPLIIQRLLYIPLNYDKHQKFSSLNFERIFPKQQQVAIEYCSGNGQWILEKAKQYPHLNWIAVEKRFDRVRKIWAKMHNDRLDNLFVVFSEAETFTKYYLKEEQVSFVFINFPDPWPKQKHAKHRLIQKEFLLDLSKVLNRSSEVTLVTDDEIYKDRMIKTFEAVESFHSFYPFPFYETKLETYGSSFFENLWKSKGRNIFYLKYIYGN